MAKFKTLSIKSKNYVFTAYENDKEKKPACVVFGRFPAEQEFFFKKDTKAILDGLDPKDASNTEKVTEVAIKIFTENFVKGNIDYSEFVRECVARFDDFEFDGAKIKTVDDYLSIKVEFTRKISAELYNYAKQEDKFTTGE
jgi:hypothetical protein